MPERKAPTGTITGSEALRTDWKTPPHLVALVREYFGGTIPYDASANASNSCGALDYSTEDGLTRDWPRQVWSNPPYGKVLREWLAKYSVEAAKGKEILTLLPCARWEQAYLQDAMSNATEVCFIRKRVNFINPETGDAVSGNPYANMFLGWNTDPATFGEVFSQAGQCFSIGLLARRNPVLDIPKRRGKKR